MPRANRRRIVLVGLAVASLLAGVLLLEGSIRAWVWFRYDGNWDTYTVYNTIYESHPHSWYRVRPENEFRVFGGRHRVETDAHGFRSPEVASTKPDNALRIAFLGGSTTFNSEASSNDATVALQTARLLERALPARRVEVLNAGTPGYTTMESLTTLATRLLPLEPDWIVVYHGINDASFRIRGEFRADYWREPKPLSTRFDSALYRHSLLVRFLNYKALINKSVPRPSLERLQANAERYSTREFERNLRSIVAVARAHQVKVVLSSFAYCPNPELPDKEAWSLVFRAIDEQNARIAELAQELNTAYLDVAAQFPQDCGLYTNQVHRTDEGLRIHATLLSNAILQQERSENEIVH